MAKMDLFNILKVNTSFIMNNNKCIHLSLVSAKEKGMVVALGDNQLLKFIRQIQDKNFDREYVRDLYSQRNHLKQLNESKQNSQKIIEIQKQIENYLYVPELISVKVDTTKKDYKDICKNGFSVTINVNGVEYKTEYTRLCAGAGQLRRNSAFFVDKKIYSLLEHIMMCGLNKSKIGKINLAKFSAYFALYTSATRQVRKPKICVIKDYEYVLKNQNIKWIFDNENGEKDISDKVMDFDINAFDGSGIISVEMAEKWQEDLGLDYLPASFILRSAWIKGLVSIFDFKKFAKEIAHKQTIVDAWGVEYNVDDIDVILTTSQFKMWKKYESWQEYMYYHQRYNHIFGVARVTKKQNNIYTPMNYQYLQSNNFTNDSIKSLANFSLDWIKKIMTGDKLYSMLFLLGSHDSDEEYLNIENRQDSYISKALMYNENILNDSYVRNKINHMIEKKVRQMKIGKLLVEGSYDFLIPDLYALCEHAFGMKVNGLLEAYECWNKRWVDKGSKKIASMRSPLVDFSENQKLLINHNEKCKEWFKYIYSGTILNIKDMTAINQSDADYDGDLVLTTDNEYVVNAVIDNQPTITYEKKKAKEQKINTNSFATMDTKSFNTKIGFITNIASTLIAMLSNFSKDSEEYKEIKKRISLLRYYQGTAIDSAKGDLFVPPPKYWNKKQKYIPINQDMTEEEIEKAINENKRIAFNNRICADKKPYFFGYVYPKIMTEYNSYKNNYKKLCKIFYKCSIYDLMKKDNKSEEESNFLYKFSKYSPLLKNKCVMNVLSEYVENTEFDNKFSKSCEKFDYTQLMSGNYEINDTKLYKKLKEIISDFNKKYSIIVAERKSIETDISCMSPEDMDCFSREIHYLIEEYENKILSICSDGRKICDYIIDIYYKYFNTKSKVFIWETFGEIVLDNVKSKAEKVQYPILDENGIDYLGRKYSIKEVHLI